MRGAAGNRFWSERGTRYCAVWPRNAKFLWSKEFSRSPLPPPASLPRSIRFIPIEPDGTDPPWAVQECLVRRFLELPRSYRFQPTPGTGMQMDERGTGINERRRHGRGQISERERIVAGCDLWVRTDRWKIFERSIILHRHSRMLTYRSNLRFCRKDL